VFHGLLANRQIHKISLKKAIVGDCCLGKITGISGSPANVHHAGAFFQQLADNSKADAFGAAGDDRNFAFQSEIHGETILAEVSERRSWGKVAGVRAVS
jgi:hypothetical protein